MLDIKVLRANKELLIASLRKRMYNFDYEKLFEYDSDFIEKKKIFDKKVHERRQIEEELKNDYTNEKYKKTLSELKIEIKTLDAEIMELEKKRNDLLLICPNILDEAVPVGKDHNDNQLIRTWNSNRKVTNLDQKTQDMALNEELIEVLRNACGSRFVGLNGKLAILHRSISNFCLDCAQKEGYIEFVLPSLLNVKGITNSGQYPVFDNDLFWTLNKDLTLAPTSEVMLSNVFNSTDIDENDLPKAYMCYSPCFRKEAGSAGKDLKGLIRVHQFHKVEIFQYSKLEESNNILEKMVQLVEKLLQKLELSYRIVLLCSGDTGFHSAKTYDLEVWMQGQGRYLEISSCSNVKTYQSMRTNVNVTDHKKTYKEKVATLNGSCLPIERTMAAIIENYIDGDKIIVPEVLRAYTKFDYIELNEVKNNL